MEQRTLYRSRQDRMLAGVCGGLGDYFRLDPTLVRLIFVLLAMFTGVGILAYVALWIVVPEEGGRPLYEQWKSEGGTPPAAPQSARADVQQGGGAVPETPGASAPATAPAPESPTAAASAGGPVPVAGASTVRPEDWRYPEDLRRGGVIPGVILVVVGALFLVNMLFPQLRLDIWKLWPVILIAIGVGMMFRPRRR